MNQTARFALPLLAPGQAQKEWFHNEALQRIDVLLCPVVEGLPVAEPPPSPSEGQCFIVAEAATGEWVGRAGAIAAFTDGGWRFIGPSEGLRAIDRDSGQILLHRNGNWELGIFRAKELRIGDQTVVRERQAAVSPPSGGSTVDAECRTALTTLLLALQSHGLLA